MVDISGLSARQLLKLYADIEEQLRSLKIISSANNPAGDLAETLFCKAFDWDRADKSQAHYDAKGKVDGKLYQIKCRRITRFNSSRQLSAIRGLEQAQHFDVLAGLLLREDYSVYKAALVPHEVVLEHSSFQKHTNSRRFLLVDDIWKIPAVRDVTEQLLNAEKSM
jgi:hypothetical protein